MFHAKIKLLILVPYYPAYKAMALYPNILDFHLDIMPWPYKFLTFNRPKIWYSYRNVNTFMICTQK